MAGLIRARCAWLLLLLAGGCVGSFQAPTSDGTDSGASQDVAVERDSGAESGTDSAGVCQQGLTTISAVERLAEPSNELLHPFFVAVDETSIYWTAYGPLENPGTDPKNTGAVFSAPKCGGAPTLLASRLRGAGPIAVDSTNIYWLSTGRYGGDPQESDSLMKVPKSGGTPTTLASKQAAYGMGIALTPTNVYWVEEAGDGPVMTVPIGGGTPTTVTSTSLQPSGGIAVDATSVYWTAIGADPSSAAILKAPLGGGASTTLTVHQGTVWPGGLAVDETSVYWIDGDGNVSKVPLNGGPPTRLATIDVAGNNHSIAVDSTSVYWAYNAGSFQKGAVMKVGLNGGPATKLTTQATMPFGLALDSTSLYFSDRADTNGNLSRIMRLTPR
jgi:hypothetical protein